jgi:hypothetical protein
VVVRPFKKPSLKPSSISLRLAESKYNSIIALLLKCKETKKTGLGLYE